MYMFHCMDMYKILYILFFAICMLLKLSYRTCSPVILITTYRVEMNMHFSSFAKKRRIFKCRFREILVCCCLKPHLPTLFSRKRSVFTFRFQVKFSVIYSHICTISVWKQTLKTIDKQKRQFDFWETIKFLCWQCSM